MPARRRCHCATIHSCVAARAIARACALVASERGAPQVATVGARRRSEPGQRRAVERGRSRVDLRNTDEAVLKEAETDVFDAVPYVRERGRLRRSRCERLARFEPVEFDADMIDLVEATALRLGHSTRRMPSGAGHDAQMLARVCPTAMVFMPSVNGLCTTSPSSPTPGDIEAGANVLLQVVLDRASQ